MPHLLLRDLPRYECLLEAARRYPTLEPASCDAFLHLLRTSDEVFEAESAFLAGHQISQGRFTVLMQLNRHPEQTSSPADLAERSGVTRATMTGLLDTMERDGLVTRTSDPADRRGVLVRMTEVGRTLIDAICPGYFAHVAEIIEPLNTSERQQLVRLLKKIEVGLHNNLSHGVSSPGIPTE